MRNQDRPRPPRRVLFFGFADSLPLFTQLVKDIALNILRSRSHYQCRCTNLTTIGSVAQCINLCIQKSRTSAHLLIFATTRERNICESDLDINSQIHAPNNLVIHGLLPNGPDWATLIFRLPLVPDSSSIHRCACSTPPRRPPQRRARPTDV